MEKVNSLLTTLLTWRYKISFLLLKNISLVHWWSIFQHPKGNFVSPSGHVISSTYHSLKILALIHRLIRPNQLAFSIFGRRKHYYRFSGGKWWYTIDQTSFQTQQHCIIAELTTKRKCRSRLSEGEIAEFLTKWSGRNARIRKTYRWRDVVYFRGVSSRKKICSIVKPCREMYDKVFKKGFEKVSLSLN